MVPSGHVLERMGHEEMRVKISTAEFGNVELRANVVEDRVGATISATHPELHAAMMAEMPRLERAIEQHQLHLDLLDLHARGEDGEREGRNHQHTRPVPSLLSSSTRKRPEARETPPTASWLWVSHDGGLSVHA